jgi:lysophospholipase L1-like esterase
MGGSTTYATEVGRPEQAWPAQLEALLNRAPPGGSSAVEVINAGIPGGTSAEILTHYQFKFRYYRPDLVIIHSGGNDARATYPAYYHPDYSNTRRQLQMPRSLPPAGRALLRSRLLSLFIVPLLHGPYPHAGFFYDYGGQPPPVPWYASRHDQQGRPEIERVLKDGLAFRHNLLTVIQAIRRDGGRVLLVPFRSNPREPYEPQELLPLLEQVLVELAREDDVGLAANPAEVISVHNWVDSCHLNPDGQAEKAAYLLPFVEDQLEGAQPK